MTSVAATAASVNVSDIIAQLRQGRLSSIRQAYADSDAPSMPAGALAYSDRVAEWSLDEMVTVVVTDPEHLFASQYTELPPLEPVQEFGELIYPSEVHPETNKLIARADRSFWVADKVSLLEDARNWPAVPPEDQKIILNVLTFFATSDAGVCDNLLENLLSHMKMLELTHFYVAQSHIEMVHSKVYRQLLDCYAKGDELQQLLNAHKTNSALARKVKWVQTALLSDNMPLSERVLVFALVEAIFFSSSFAVIYYYKNRNLRLPGLFDSNDYISRDEGLHVEFALHILNVYMLHLPHPDRVLQLVRSAVDAELEFVRSMMSLDRSAMNSEYMTDYVQATADDLLRRIGLPSYYKTKNPFPFIAQMGLPVRTNFFERENSNYRMATCDY